MSTSLQHGPTSFRTRFAAGTLGFRDVMAIVLAGTGACALGLWSLDAALVGHPVQAEVRALAGASRDFTARDRSAIYGGFHLYTLRPVH